jgi:hypothetical protein
MVADETGGSLSIGKCCQSPESEQGSQSHVAAWLSQQLAQLANRSFEETVKKSYSGNEVGPIRLLKALSHVTQKPASFEDVKKLFRPFLLRHPGSRKTDFGPFQKNNRLPHAAPCYSASHFT